MFKRARESQESSFSPPSVFIVLDFSFFSILVAALFEDHPDLLEDFTRFLLDTSAAP